MPLLKSPVTMPSVLHQCSHIIIDLLSLLQPHCCHQSSMFFIDVVTVVVALSHAVEQCCSSMLSLSLLHCHCAVNKCSSSMSSLMLSHCCCVTLTIIIATSSLSYPCHLQMLLALKNNIAHKGGPAPCPFHHQMDPSYLDHSCHALLQLQSANTTSTTVSCANIDTIILRQGCNDASVGVVTSQNLT